MAAITSAVTFLFTDIEGSTRLWEDVPTRMPDVLLRHDRLCASVIEAHRGRVIKTMGDGLHAAFADLQRLRPYSIFSTGSQRLPRF